MSTITSMQQTVAPANTKNDTTTSNVKAGQKPTASDMRTSLNAQIIEASMTVSVKAGDNPQGLLFRTSLESIYDSIGGFESKINPDYKMPSMNDANNPFATPEGTANVILGFSLGLYANYSASHKGEDEAEMATNFVNLVRSGFEKGYKEATDILEALSVFNGDVKSEIQQTWDLVQKGYDDWLSSTLDSISAKNATATTTDNTVS